METIMRRSGIGCQLWSDLMLADASSMLCVSRTICETGRPFVNVIAFALTRPQWCHFVNADCLGYPTLANMSLRTWAALADDCTRALQAVNLSSRTLTVELARTLWTTDVFADGELASIEWLQSKVVLHFLKRCLGCCSSVEDLDVPWSRSRPSLLQTCSGVVALALKGTFAYIKDYSPIPGPGLVCLLFLPHQVLTVTAAKKLPQQAFPISALVEAHSLASTALNGVPGTVIGYQGELVCVKFAHDVKAVPPAKLKILSGGRFAFVRFARLSHRVSGPDTIIGNSIQAVAQRSQERFGGQVWDLDEFGQLAWVRGNPDTWFEDGGYFNSLLEVRKSVAKTVRPSSTREDVAISFVVGSLGEEDITSDNRTPECVCSTSRGSAALPDAEGVETIVTEEIEHQEPAAVLHPDEAAAVCDVQWAGFAERLLARSAPAQLHEHVNALDDAPETTGAESSDRTVMVAGPLTAPAEYDLRQCLLPGTLVQLRSGRAINIAELRVGDELLSGHSTSAVRAIRIFDARDRDIVQIAFASSGSAATHENLVVTASHALAIYRPSCNRFQPVLASDVQVGDRLRSQCLECTVQCVTKSIICTGVSEIELHDTSSSMYISTGSTPVQAYGATCPKLGNNQVRILSFNRFDRFRELLLENEELEACRQALIGKGFNPDLGTYELGPGKMLVRADLADSVLRALALRSGPTLKCTDVVVSSEFEPIVKLAVRHAPRKIFVQHEEVLELCHTHTKGTFLEVSSSSHEPSAVVCSTTDADKRKGKNPRRLAQRASE